MKHPLLRNHSTWQSIISNGLIITGLVMGVLTAYYVGRIHLLQDGGFDVEMLYVFTAFAITLIMMFSAEALYRISNQVARTALTFELATLSHMVIYFVSTLTIAILIAVAYQLSNLHIENYSISHGSKNVIALVSFGLTALCGIPATLCLIQCDE